MTLSKFEDIFCIQLPISWQEFFSIELQKSYFPPLIQKVCHLYEEKLIYPPKDLLWQAFLLTPLEKLCGVLIGQDPYHGPNQACGLAFSLPANQKITPSLRNILKEVARTTQASPAHTGDLSHWASQGVLLLNTILTVEPGLPLSHKNLGWTKFSDHLIQFISSHKRDLFFFLWGKQAQNKIPLINNDSFLLLSAPHPSPLSRQPFVGCECFLQANTFLKDLKKHPIDW